MAGQYSHRQFFRRVPNELLARYFTTKEVSLGLDVAELDDAKGVESIFDAFTNLPEDQQAVMEVDFQDIDAMACEGGIGALLDEADFHENGTFPEEISAIDGFHAKAMWSFLDKSDYWRGASAFLHADTVSRRSWKKRNDLPHVPPHVEEEDIEQLANAISHYFFKKEGRGKNCKVEPYRRIDKEYFFAYPEDYGQSGVEWERDKLTTRPRHPAFEIIFVYCEKEGSLDIYAPSLTKVVHELQQIFAKTILKLDTLPEGGIDKRVYDLDPMADPNFEFQLPEESDIVDAIVTKLRLTLKHGSKRRITLEADTSRNSQAVYDLLKELNPQPYFITQIGVKAVFETEPGKRAKTKTFTITYPNSCNLSHDGKDSIIRKMLAASGIEPHTTNDDKGE